MDSAWNIWTSPDGFPHSGTHGSLPAFGFPWLFVDRYALLRLLVPRHPPCALSSLTSCRLSAACVFHHARITLLGSLYPCCKLLNQKGYFSLGYHKCFRIHASLLLLFALFSFQGAERIPSEFLRSCSQLRCSQLASFFPLGFASLFHAAVSCLMPESLFPFRGGGLKWTRTIDLTLIRRAL